MSEQESLIEFPSRFPIKVMGATHPEFSQTIFELVRVHAPDIIETDIEMRASSGGNYVSLTVTITAVSKDQLDNIYRVLTAHPMVKYAL
jgi:putative lipoic acid-binding regulatory protein